MSPGDRAFLIKRAMLSALADCRGYPILESSLREATVLKVDFLGTTTAEIDMALREIDTARLAIALPTERGRKIKLTDAGTLWLAENA